MSSTASAFRGYSASTDKTVLQKMLKLEQPANRVMCEYIWVDGTDEGLRSKCRTLDFEPQRPQGMCIWVFSKSIHGLLQHADDLYSGMCICLQCILLLTKNFLLETVLMCSTTLEPFIFPSTVLTSTIKQGMPDP